MDDTPADDILEATYHALCKHGYADLTLQQIAAESERSKSSIHYHYDSKDELFVAFLDFLYERRASQLASVDGDTPRERLASLLDALLSFEETAADGEFQTAMLEVAAQAPYDDAIRRRIAEFDQYLFETVREIIEDGVETGEFDTDLEPAVAADLLTTTVRGAHTRRVAVDHPTDRLHETMDQFVEDHLVAAGAVEEVRG
ncbi:transcriptional regulator, TetR family [Natronoarchaeum philippinense]|uniref:Transcriptional regulator, TetR family n=1 Tax=Natronoarchaeum philippinense TaxID=558529 RepID=A0A285NT95_NATPI|nr:TetR/AcrR family transcriptional regulator [Natronoarchaeum philippinense]SNZ12659.1 transcriptional regulator, TetR family [Natronoarchaeum philippinense]